MILFHGGAEHGCVLDPAGVLSTGGGGGDDDILGAADAPEPQDLLGVIRLGTDEDQADGAQHGPCCPGRQPYPNRPHGGAAASRDGWRQLDRCDRHRGEATQEPHDDVVPEIEARGADVGRVDREPDDRDRRAPDAHNGHLQREHPPVRGEVLGARYGASDQRSNCADLRVVSEQR